jgi:hypothetical protein
LEGEVWGAADPQLTPCPSQENIRKVEGRVRAILDKVCK